MKRMVCSLMVGCFLACLLSLASGCSEAGGNYFQSSRETKPHVFRNRIYNPADYRYTTENEG